MFRMMTPIDAIGLSLRAGMMFGQTQTLWMTRMMEMQGFWIGIPRINGDDAAAPASADADDVAVVLPPLTEIHVEALAAAAEAAAKPAPVAESVADVQVAAEPVVEAVADLAPVAEVPPVVEREPAPVVAPLAEPAPAVVQLASAKSKRPRKSADSAE